MTYYSQSPDIIKTIGKYWVGSDCWRTAIINQGGKELVVLHDLYKNRNDKDRRKDAMNPLFLSKEVFGKGLGLRCHFRYRGIDCCDFFVKNNMMICRNVFDKLGHFQSDMNMNGNRKDWRFVQSRM